MRFKFILFLFVFICLVVVFFSVKFVHDDRVYKRTSNRTETELLQSKIANNNDIDEKGGTNKTYDYSDEFSVYNNPIDEYFLPKIYSWDTSQIEIRKYQDSYKKAWKAEFKNLMNWLQKKCIYANDKKNIKLLKKSVLDNIEKSKEVILTELLDVYKVNPDSAKVKDTVSRISYWGNGTQSRLNQIEGEIYRDASMRIINLYGEERKYVFQKIDYSNKK